MIEWDNGKSGTVFELGRIRGATATRKGEDGLDSCTGTVKADTHVSALLAFQNKDAFIEANCTVSSLSY